MKVSEICDIADNAALALRTNARRRYCSIAHRLYLRARITKFVCLGGVLTLIWAATVLPSLPPLLSLSFDGIDERVCERRLGVFCDYSTEVRCSTTGRRLFVLSLSFFLDADEYWMVCKL